MSDCTCWRREWHREQLTSRDASVSGLITADGRKPLLKMLAIKVVGQSVLPTALPSQLTIFSVFLTFWQATALSLLTVFGLVKDVRPSETFTQSSSHSSTPYDRRRI